MSGHWLVIHEKGEDYTIEHEDGCTQIEMYDENPFDPGSGPIMDWDCLIGRIVRAEGIDDHLTDIYGRGWKDLEPGRYEIKSWENTYSGGYSHYEEYEAGIEFVGNPVGKP